MLTRLQPGTRVTIVRDQDPYLPTGNYVGLTGTLITDHSANGDDVVRYTVRFGDGTGRRGDSVNGWVWCAEVRPV
jgi:uncharacterized protein (DUF2249 family)